MTPNRAHEGSLRLDRLEISRLLWALAISLAIHLLCYGTYELGRVTGLWQRLNLPVWLHKTTPLARTAKESKPPVLRDVPLVFVDVNPQLATPDAPKDAKYYSDKNSKATNPDADKETDVPKITGHQEEVTKTEDVKRSQFDKLQPAFPVAKQERPQENARPELPTPPGDLAMAKPDVTLRQDPGTAEESRPRTIKEALMRLHRNQLVGEKMKQEGGVSRRLEFTSLDAKATPFGAYDAAFIEVVQSHWYDLLDNVSYAGYRHGKVVVQFHLNYDGRITEMKVVENSVGEMLGLLCEKAVLDPAPFDHWPREMRLMADKDYRDIQFTFYYN
jgi:hypothetical protein